MSCAVQPSANGIRLQVLCQPRASVLFCEPSQQQRWSLFHSVSPTGVPGEWTQEKLIWEGKVCFALLCDAGESLGFDQEEDCNAYTSPCMGNAPLFLFPRGSKKFPEGGGDLRAEEKFCHVVKLLVT